MNVEFWFAASILLIVAFLILIPPLWKRRELVDAEADQRNIKIARERAEDLKQQLKSGQLTQLQFDEQYAELQSALSDDLDLPQKVQETTATGRWLIVPIAVLVPLFSIFSYLLLGEPDALKKAEIQQQQRSATPPVDINAMVSGLVKKLQQDPNNAQGWQMLGRSYKYLKKYAASAQAFEKANQLVTNDPGLMLQYADALALVNGGSLKGKASNLVFKAIQMDPENPTGLWLAGMAKAENREFQPALQYWNKLETLIPPEEKSYKDLQVLISAVKAQLSGAKPNIQEPVKKEIQAVNIHVKVSISENIRDQMSASDTVFIYARALSGPPMPLAIIRKKVSDLPISVDLNDAMAMMPNMKLSNFKQVEVLGRVSKAGIAMPQAGDFVGSQKINDLNANSAAEIVISEQIK